MKKILALERTTWGLEKAGRDFKSFPSWVTLVTGFTSYKISFPIELTLCFPMSAGNQQKEKKKVSKWE